MVPITLALPLWTQTVVAAATANMVVSSPVSRLGHIAGEVHQLLRGVRHQHPPL